MVNFIAKRHSTGQLFLFSSESNATALSTIHDMVGMSPEERFTLIVPQFDAVPREIIWGEYSKESPPP